MAQAVYWTVNACILLAIPVSGFLWVRLLWRCGGSPKKIAEAVPVRARQRPFWTPAEFLVMFGGMAILAMVFRLQAVEMGLLPKTNETADIGILLTSVAIMASAGVCALIITLSWLHLFQRQAWRRLELSIGPGDMKLGLRGALMILPPVILISAAASYFKPYSHPVLESLADSPKPLLFAAMFASTAILTPIVEEFTFRQLLQGGLQGMLDRKVDPSGLWRPTSYVPLLITSLVFAAMHYGQGAAHIPLFFLSLGLGYLYRQTGRIAAPIIIHMILNGVTLCVEFSRLQMEV